MNSKPRFWTSLHGLACIVMIAAALYFLLVEHGEHVLPYLPFLIILLCPLMHLFMHKHHHNGDGAHSHPDTEEAYRRGLEAGRKASGNTDTEKAP